MKSKPVRLDDWLSWARKFLSEAHRVGSASADPQSPLAVVSTPQEASLDAQVLLAHVLEKPRAWVIAHPEVILTPQQQARLTKLLSRLVSGEPLPYLTGHQEFYGLDFEVTPAVLIPRPETELLVERGLDWLRKHPTRRRTADVGTGSGCIAISLARPVLNLRILAVDCSLAALEVAKRNAVRHNVEGQIEFMQGDLLTGAGGPFDLVCANLPYIPQPALSSLPVAQHEPRQALDGGLDGLQLIRRLVEDAPRWLAPGGLLLLEMQSDQGDAITHLVHEHLPDARAVVLSDLAGLPRVMEAER